LASFKVKVTLNWASFSFERKKRDAQSLERELKPLKKPLKRGFNSLAMSIPHLTEFKHHHARANASLLTI
jgi:hypothetical protein